MERKDREKRREIRRVEKAKERRNNCREERDQLR